MNIHKRAKSAIGRVPFLERPYRKLAGWKARAFKDTAPALKEDVRRLEARNEEWAAEVRSLRRELDVERNRKLTEDLSIVWPAEPALIAAAKPVTQHKTKLAKGQRPTIGFVIPPADPGSGGHTTIFRFVDFLEKKGYACTLYVYDPLHGKEPGQATAIIKQHFRPLKARIVEGVAGLERNNVLIATSWPTAYPVVTAGGTNTRFYFVQDFEPWFDAVGSYSTLAENTYKYGLYGITAGRWLADKLRDDYGMRCSYFNFGVDKNIYYDLQVSRSDICFYARPGSPRRGFELGALVLEELCKRNPGLQVHCFGGDLARYKLPFAFRNYGVVSHQQLNAIYNKCRAGLVFSFTNMSLIPQEMLSSGCIPVVNDGDNNRKVFSNKHVAFVKPDVQKIVETCETLLYKKPAEYFTQAAAAHGSGEWEKTWDGVEAFMLERAVAK